MHPGRVQPRPKRQGTVLVALTVLGGGAEVAGTEDSALGFNTAGLT